MGKKTTTKYFVREDEDEFFWTNQEPQPFEPE